MKREVGPAVQPISPFGRWRGTALTLAALLLSGPAAADGLPLMPELAKGQALPLPFGLGLVYTNTRQDLDLQSIDAAVNGNQTAASTLVHLGDSQLKSSSVLVKGDLWLTPFLNLFAFAGQASNKAQVDFTLQGQEIADYYGSSACSGEGNRPAFCDRTFEGHLDRDSDALNYGGGASLAAASGRAFVVVSAIYAVTDAKGGDTEVKTFSAAPRVGLRFAVDGGGMVATYLGASYLDSKIKFGNQTTIDTGAPEASNIPSQIVIDYDIKQKNQDKWSYLAGVSWDVSRAWTLQGEYAVGAREGLLTSLVWRFGG